MSAVLIVGCGITGTHLAESLADQGREVAIVDKNAEVCARLRAWGKARVIHGDGCQPAVLRQAGIGHVQVVAALTGHDEDNLIIAFLAKREFNVPRVVARVIYPGNEWLFMPAMGVDDAVSSAHIISKLLEEEISTGELVTLLKLAHGEVALVEETVAEGSPAANKALSELPLPEDCALAAVVRGQRVLVPGPRTVLQPGDEVLAIVKVENEMRLVELLRHPQQTA